MRWMLLLSLMWMLSLEAGGNLLTNGDFELSKTPKDFRGYDFLNAEKLKFFEVDTAVKHNGKASARISGVNGTWFALIQKGFNVEDLKKPVLIRGWAKYENLVSRLPDGKLAGMPFVGLWSRTIKGKNGPGFGINCFAEGSRDWFQFQQVFEPASIHKRFSTLKGEQKVVSLSFRINVASQPGTVWFDDLEMIELENEELSAQLPLKDVTGNTLNVKLTVDDSVQEGAEAELKCGNNSLPVKLKAGENLISFPLAGLKQGEHVLSVYAGKGFKETGKKVELKFLIIKDAFDEQ